MDKYCSPINIESAKKDEDVVINQTVESILNNEANQSNHVSKKRNFPEFLNSLMENKLEKVVIGDGVAEKKRKTESDD